MSFKSLKTVPVLAMAAVCVTAAIPSFAAKPYDAQVEYLEAPIGSDNKTPYIDTGLYPGDDMGARIRFMPLRTADSTLCGVQTTSTSKWYFGGPFSATSGNGIYMAWMNDMGTRTRLASGSVYEVFFNYMNDRDRRMLDPNNGNAVLSQSSINSTWTPGTGELKTIWLYHFNNAGSRPTSYYGNYRIYSATFTQGDAIVMNLIPVIKDGVGYMYDTQSETLLGKVEGSSSSEFKCGRSIVDESVTLDADADWTHLGQLLISSGVTIDLNGHVLRIVGADGEGTITDSSSGTPGLLRVTASSSVTTPVTVAATGVTIFRSSKPYDAQVEYLEAPLSGSNVPYIDTGLYPGNNRGVLMRVMPLRASDDTTVCGVQSYSAADKTNFKWYFGFTSSNGGGYLSWDTSNPGSRFSYSANKLYDIHFNHLNDRNRQVTGVDNAYEFNLAIANTWPDAAATNTIYLFAYNNNGSKVGNTGNARIYSAQFTEGGKVVMDLIPVRKGNVGYMYDKVSEKLLGKVATAPGAFTYVNDAAGGAYIEGNVTLDADADWTSRGIVRIDGSATIDLNGHSLTLAGAYGDGTITNSSETVGEVRFVVPERMEHTTNVRLLGNLKVVKEGGGTLSLSRTGQTFTGGVDVAAGVAHAVADEAGRCWGADGGEIRIASGATFSLNGQGNFYLKDFVLDGGTISNAVPIAGTGLGNVTLEADSTIVALRYCHFKFNPPDANRTINLGGHTLTVSLVYGAQFCLYEPIVGDGSIVFQKKTAGDDGGWFQTLSGQSIGSPTLNLEVNTSAINLVGEVVVSNYTARYVGAFTAGDAAIKVHGTFTPAAVDENGLDYFHGCEMQNGSTIDLHEKTSAWDVLSTGWAATTVDVHGNRTVTFADNATVTIDLHGRELAKGEKIVSWSAAPSNLATLTFALDAATAEAGESLVVTESGIYYAADENTVAHAHWTGAVDNDVTNPGNWACTNFMGNAVSGEHGVPGASAAVHFSGEMAVQIPASQPIPYDSIHFGNVVLTNDCDWSGLAEWAIFVNNGDTVDLGSVDLNGHALRLVSPTTGTFAYDFVTLAVTDSSSGAPGELHIDVPDATTYLVCSGFALSGNLKLVKDGAGWLAMTRANQTFAGGVVIAEGTGYSPYGGNYPESNNYWGAANTTITVLTNATFDARGNINYVNKTFVLDGGTLANTSSMGGDFTKNGFGNVTLLADSIFITSRSDYTLFSAPNGTEKIDLGGHALTNSLVYGANTSIPLAIENGTMVVKNLTNEEDGGYIRVNTGMAGGSATFNLVMETAAFYLDGTLSVNNYVAKYTGGYNHGAGTIKVYGTFSPAAARTGGDAFHGCEMQNGSFIDLSAKTSPFSAVALGFSGSDNMDGNRTMTFADGATVGILFGNRNVKSEEKVIDWSAAVPENRDGLTFYGQFANGSKTTLKIKDDGLYAPKKGMTIIVR